MDNQRVIEDTGLDPLVCVERARCDADRGNCEYNINPYLDTIKLTLRKVKDLNALDKARAFDIINEKRVDIKLLHWAYPSVEAYNVKVREQKDYWPRKELTPEEFEFIGKLGGAR